MIVNHPNSVATHRRMRMTAEFGQADGLGGRMFDSLRQMFCGLHGHDALLHFEHQRISLRCASCGYETPGWDLNEVPPTVTARADARRKVPARPHLVSARRIA
jgi:hypothetical protein